MKTYNYIQYTEESNSDEIPDRSFKYNLVFVIMYFVSLPFNVALSVYLIIKCIRWNDKEDHIYKSIPIEKPREEDFNFEILSD